VSDVQYRFQFTRPRGARHAVGFVKVPPGGFNSRAHAGRDRDGSNPRLEGSFQFTRPRGARLGDGPGAGPGRVSIHAPTRGATYGLRHCATSRQFQFTRPRGARPSLAISR